MDEERNNEQTLTVVMRKCKETRKKMTRELTKERRKTKRARKQS